MSNNIENKVMKNIIEGDWPDILTPSSMNGRLVKIYDADGIECAYAVEVNRLTGECWRFLRMANGRFHLLAGQPAIEKVILKLPITITEVGILGKYEDMKGGL